jgi:hypothetical protein
MFEVLKEGYVFDTGVRWRWKSHCSYIVQGVPATNRGEVRNL